MRGELLKPLPVSYEEFRGLVMQELATLRPDGFKPGAAQLGHLCHAVAQAAVLTHKLVPDPNGPTPDRHAMYELSNEDWAKTHDILWDLIVEHIVRPGLGDRDNSAFPNFHLTEYGREVMSKPSMTPYDPDGYLKRLRELVPAVDPDILVYVEESLKTFRIGCLLSSSVMLGCASEKALLLLLDAYAETLEPAKRKKFEDAIDGKTIKSQYDEFHKRLQSHLFTLLDRDLRADLETRLLGIFSMLREIRNQAGHPTGKNVDRPVCYANINVFPTYLRKVYDLIEWLKAKGAGTL